MAVNNIPYNGQTQAGLSISSIARACRTLTDQIANHVSVEAAKIDGDGSDPAHFSAMVAEGTFATNDAAKASYDQMNSLLANLAGAPSAGMKQTADYHGQA